MTHRNHAVALAVVFAIAGVATGCRSERSGTPMPRDAGSSDAAGSDSAVPRDAPIGVDAGDDPDAGDDVDAGPPTDGGMDSDGGGGTDVDIRSIQNGSVPTDTDVRIADVVVTGIVSSSSSAFLFVQEPSGDAAYSGVAVFIDLEPPPAFSLPARGDRITFAGTVREFSRMGEAGTRTNIEDVTELEVLGAGTIPAPAIVAVQDLAYDDVSPEAGEEWEGVLVRVNDVEVLTRDSFGEVTIFDGAPGIVKVDDRLHAWEQPDVGELFAGIVGIVDHDRGSARLLPRDDDDLLGDPAVVSLSPASTSIGVGGSATFTVTLRRSAPAGGSPVAIATSDGAIAAPSAALVMVPEGMGTATFDVDGVALGGPVTISASGGGLEAQAQVSVVGAGGPVLTMFEAATYTVAENGTGVLRVGIDRAAPAGGFAIALSSSASGLVAIPTSVTVPEGLDFATFRVEASSLGVTSSSIVTATAAGGMTTTTLQVTNASPAPGVGDVVINELLYDPPPMGGGMGDANCNGVRNDNDEFVELLNVTNHAVSLNGVSLWDVNAYGAGAGLTPRFTFGAIVLGPGEAVVVFGEATDGSATNLWCTSPGDATATTIGDALAFGIASGGFGLGNSGDTVYLTATASAASSILAQQDWVDGAASDQSYARAPEGTGLFSAFMSIAGSATDRLFSPGSRNDGRAFAFASP